MSDHTHRITDIPADLITSRLAAQPRHHTPPHPSSCPLSFGVSPPPPKSIINILPIPNLKAPILCDPLPLPHPFLSGHFMFSEFAPPPPTPESRCPTFKPLRSPAWAGGSCMARYIHMTREALASDKRDGGCSRPSHGEKHLCSPSHSLHLCCRAKCLGGEDPVMGGGAVASPITCVQCGGFIELSQTDVGGGGGRAHETSPLHLPDIRQKCRIFLFLLPLQQFCSACVLVEVKTH